MRKSARFLAVVLIAAALVGCSGEKNPAQTTTVTEADTTPAEQMPTAPETGEGPTYTPGQSTMRWEEGAILPTFADPAEELDAFDTEELSRDELIFVSTLQGIVNRTKPRILLLDHGDEGSETWPKTFKLKYAKPTARGRMDVYIKYLPEVSGAVIYDEKDSQHMVNLACSAANSMNAVPMTKSFYDKLVKKGYTPEIKADLTGLGLKSAKDIYTYLYDNYWKDLSHRLIFTENPGDSYHMRDLAAATGSAIVYFDCVNATEKALYKKFLGNMEAGKSAAMGFYSSERGGITTASSMGISTIPADLFCNATVYGIDKEVIIPTETKIDKEVENKIYLAVYISDGDNLQYNERYMRKLWDQTSGIRGRVPLNWTISPALATAAPDMMNYFYSTAKENDYFVCGPSGMGYTMPYNTLNEEIRSGNFMKDNDLFEAYTAMSERYLTAAGLRVVTIWDKLSDDQREIYVRTNPGLYGITVQQWGQSKNTIDGVTGDKYIAQLTPCYESAYGALVNNLKQSIGNWDGSSPLFISCQVSVWSEIKPASILTLLDDLNKLYDGKVEMLRADHFFNLYNQVNGLPADLTLFDGVSASAGSGDAALALDGSPSTGHKWIPTGSDNSITFDLGGSHEITAYELFGLEKDAKWTVEVSDDGTNFTALDNAQRGEYDFLYKSVTPTTASYLRITFSAGAGIGDIDIWGK